MKCDGLPNPKSFSQMNTYLYLWKKDSSRVDIEKVLEKTNEVLKVSKIIMKGLKNLATDGEAEKRDEINYKL